MKKPENIMFSGLILLILTKETAFYHLGLVIGLESDDFF